MRKSINKTRIPIAIFIACTLQSTGCGTTNLAQRSERVKRGDRVDIGFGEIDREEFIGAISAAHTAGDQNHPRQSIADILRGQIAGVHVEEVAGGGLRVRIRGANSFMGGNAPLYVVDGMPVRTENGVLYDINPYDIESITILRDAASAAIYGSRGTNGVVLIQTKIGSY